MDAIDVARLMHRLFSAFDAAVTGAGLFKMDTVGDAYVAAGFLPQSQPLPFQSTENADALEAGQACDRVLLAARDMIAAVAACREDTGRDVHCRIGVSAGEVLAGVLGRLQPRFHIFGAGLSAAERHEKAGQIDAVHASPAFMAALALPADSQVDGIHFDGASRERSGLSSAAPIMSELKDMPAGSSGRWDVRQSNVIDLPSSFSHIYTVSGQGEADVSSQVARGSAAVPDLPEDLSGLSRERTSSSNLLRLPSTSSFVGGSISDAKASLLGDSAGSQRRSFILLPLPDPEHSNQYQSEPGWRFYHATALASGVPSADMCFDAQECRAGPSSGANQAGRPALAPFSPLASSGTSASPGPGQVLEARLFAT
jgi:hypothetical protein